MKTSQVFLLTFVFCSFAKNIVCVDSEDRVISIQTQFGFLVKDIKLNALQTPAQAFEQCRKMGECGGEEALVLTFGKRVIYEGTGTSYQPFHELSASLSHAEIDEQKKEEVVEKSPFYEGLKLGTTVALLLAFTGFFN